MSPQDRTRLTFHYESWRAISAGIIETAGTTFLLLIAVRWYEAGAISKAMVAGGGSLGFCLAPWVVSLVEASRWPTAVAASRLAALGALSFLVMALFPAIQVFVIGSIVAMTCSSAAVPLMTQVYQDNYPDAERGRRFSRTIMIRIATAAVFSELAGRLLSGHSDRFRWLLLIFAVAFAFGSYCLSRCPSAPLHISGGTHPYRALKYVLKDRIFRLTLACWMFLGFATLMMGPLRIEYLANPRYGWTIDGRPLTPLMISWLTGVIPNIARLIMCPVWGWLFDRMNFFVLRIILNAGFALGILTFFGTGSLIGLVLAAIVFGISTSGADVAWSLWVTKFAPPNRVADYMSGHTFFTGVRGIFAPLAAFQLASRMKLSSLGWISFALIVIGSSFLLPEIKFGRSKRAAAVLMDEPGE